MNGAETCPYDGRFVPKGKQPPSEKRARVYQFLTQLYVESAEPIPDGLNSNKRPRSGEHKVDPTLMDRSEIKHLPPGTFNDYHRLCQSQMPEVKVSRKLFCSATCFSWQVCSLVGGAWETLVQEVLEFLGRRFGRKTSRQSSASARGVTMRSAASASGIAS